MRNSFLSLLKPKPDMELVSSIRYNIPIETDITGIHLKHGGFDYVIGGPGLTADILKLKNKTADDGKVYLLFTKDTKIAIEWFEDSNNKYTNVGDIYLPTLYKEQNNEYQIAVIDPEDYGLTQVDIENLAIFNNDCLVRYLEVNMAKNIPHNGIFVYKPKEMSQEVGLISLDMRVTKFAQFYLKAYRRLGLSVDFNTYKVIWRYICASTFSAEKLNDLIKMTEWIDGLKTEDLTIIR